MARWGRCWGAVVLCVAVATVLVLVPPVPAEAAAPCATAGKDGTQTLSGVINTYYPGTATAAAGSTSISLGTATGAASPITPGDLLLVIQMQDAAIDSTNTSAYGDGVAGDPATGWTTLNSAGLYEYAVASNTVPLAGGPLSINSGLINTYSAAASTATMGQRDFQVIRVPQYVAATLTSGLTAAGFNGSTGGVLVFDVDAALNLNGATVSVSQEGFRGGLGRGLTGGAGGGATDYVNLSANPFHGQKGEGIAGTQQYVFNSLTGTTVNNGADGYPNGSTARGAPGTAGGGGTDPDPTANDQNTGGGGGANGGAGGKGGNSWFSDQPMGGFGGTGFPAGATRVTAGAGGGAGTRNNSSGNASSGGNGGGIVMIRTGSVTGAGTITADGGTGPVPQNDGGGGGGAGGTVVLATLSGGFAGLTVDARGGAGANAWPTDAGGVPDYHGPGGGGGGGVALYSSVPSAVNVGGGVNGTTTTSQNAYGATPGTAGVQATILASQIPGAGSGAQCTPDLTIAKSHVDPLIRGSSGTYTLTVSNVGGAATSGTTTVSDTLPAGLTPTAAGGAGWTCGIAAPVVTCTSTAAVPSNGSFPPIAITVTVAQSAPASVTNTATASGGGEVNTANDSASDLTNIVSRADIAVSKVASSGTVTVGSNVTFTITVNNNGPSDASGVVITDQLPAGLTFVSATPSIGTTYDSTSGLWTIGSMASGSSATVALTATVTTSGPITNTATKTAENETDPNSANDKSSATITGQAPDLTIAKSHAGAFVRGSSGSYSVTVSNIGPVASNGMVTVSDTLPAGLTPTATSGTGWSCGIAAQTVTCTRSDPLAAAGSYPAIGITVAVAQSAAASVTNTAAVSGGGELNMANDSASDVTAITSQADVGVTKVASSGSASVGSNVSFTITASNAGPSNATGVQVTDQLPAGLTFVSAVPSVGTYSNGVWTIGPLASGASATLAIVATVNTTGPIVNTAMKTAENELDPNPANDSATATVNGQAPDLTLAKTHVDPFVRGSSGASYSIVVSNVGGAPTTAAVTVGDTLPAGLTPTNATGTGWSCTVVGQVVSCTRTDTLGAGAAFPAITITVSVAQSASGSVTNVATVSGGGELNTTNDSSNDPTTIVSHADVGVSKAASSGSVAVGSSVTYTVIAFNAGPSNATGVQVTDQLPAGLTFVSATASAGSYASGTGIWNIGPLASGASATLTLTATVTGTGTITNMASKSAENEMDPNTSNDSASAAIVGQPASGIPGPPNGGMAAAPQSGPDPLRGSLIVEAGLVAFFALLFLRRRSQRVAVAAALVGLATMTSVLAPAGAPITTAKTAQVVTRSSDDELFGKPIATARPQLGSLQPVTHPATGAVIPFRIRIPAIGVDAMVESVGLTSKGSMDVPSNIWDAAWLQTGVHPGAAGQAIIDGHLDSVRGPALFIDLHRLTPGDRIYVSDASGGELAFQVTDLQVEPLDGFPAVRVFGPARGHLLNLITCAGHFGSARRTYDHRLVVFTTLVTA